MKRINEVAALIMYNGPTIEEVLSEATFNNCMYTINYDNSVTELIVYSIVAYNTPVIDKYYYDESKKLIKQILVVNCKEKLVFDKYGEAIELLKQIDKSNKIVA